MGRQFIQHDSGTLVTVQIHGMSIGLPNNTDLAEKVIVPYEHILVADVLVRARFLPA